MTHPKHSIVGVILAGGLSRRMGEREKSLIELGGKPLIGHVIDRLAPQVDRMIINANGEPARLSGFGLPVQADTVTGFAGPLAGILAGMRWCQHHAPVAEYILTAAADTPFFPRDLAEQLAGNIADEPKAIALAASNGRRHPVFGLWSVALADDLEAFLVREESRKVLAFVERYPNCEVTFGGKTELSAGVDPFFNVNAPEDLIQAQALVAGEFCGG